MYRGVIVAIVAIIGFSMIGTGYLSGNDNDNDKGWFNNFWGKDNNNWFNKFWGNDNNNWFKKSWDDLKSNKFMGFMSTGGSSGGKCDCEDRKNDHKKHYDDFDKYYNDHKNKMDKNDYTKFMKEIEDYMDKEGKKMDKADYKMFMDYHEKFLKDNKNKFSSSDYKHSSDEHEKYSKDYPKHDDGCKCVPDRDDDKPMIDHAIINFNIVQRELKVHDSDEIFYQNVVDQCIFETADSFAPLCVKCVFLDSQDTIVAKGEVVELDQSYTGGTELPIQMSPVTWADPYTLATNDVQDVDKVELTLCGEKCVPVFADFTELKHGSREAAINAAMASQGISVSGIGNNGPSEVIIFDADKTGTADPDLEVKNGFHLLILPEKGTLNDANNDGYIDSPNDAAAGGTISIHLTAPKYLKSFVIVDHENDIANSKAIAYDSANNQIGAAVPLPNTGDGGFATVVMNKANVMRLDVTYMDSGGITNIDLKCSPPEQNCDCEKPDKFIVQYMGPNGVKVEMSKNGKDKVSLPGTYNNGDQIVIDAIALGFKNGKVYPETTYDFIKYGKSVGSVTIHTSCSQPLYVGQMFFYNQGKSDQIKLTVVSGTLKGEPSIPDASCPVPPPEEPKCEECEKPDKFTVLYDKGPSNVKVEIYKNAADVGISSKRLATLLGPFSPGSLIMLDSNLDLGQTKVNANTVYNFVKDGKSVGVVSIHTSCSQPLYVGQEFYYHQGNSDQIKLIVDSGTLKGIPSIPDESCPVPPPKCECEDDKDHYEKYYDNHKKYYDDNKYKFQSSDYKNYMDEHEKYLNDYGKYMDKSEYKKHTDYFKKFLDDNKYKFSSSDYKKYSDEYKKYSDDYKNHDDSCKCGDEHDKDGKDHHDKDDDDKDYKHKDDKNSKDYQYKYGKDHDD